jgi:hypothetical protein
LPSITNLDASTSIVSVSSIFWIAATSAHLLPRSISWRRASSRRVTMPSIRSTHSCASFVIPTATTFCVFKIQMRTSNDSPLAAIAKTFPKYTITAMRQFFYNQSTYSPTSQVNVMAWHF